MTEQSKPITSLMKERYEKLLKLKKLGMNPYSYKKFERTHTTSKFVDEFKHLKPEQQAEGINVKIAGRIVAKRVHGKVAFSDLLDMEGKLQLFFRKNELGNSYDLFVDLVDVGDILGVEGTPYRTKKGELSLWVKKFVVLSKSLRPIPHGWFGVKDVETRYRQRYLDLIINEESRKTALTVSKMINALRSFFLQKGFLEVETPVLQPIYGGAFARPFETYHHFLDQKMYLRIAPELYLKRLIVGGLEKVFEFAKCFRNESVDSTHNPEFVQIEAYWAYANYEDMMKLFEEAVAYTAKQLFGTTKITFQGKEIDVKPPWPRMTMAEAIKKYGGPDVLSLSEKELKELARQHGIEKVRWGEIIEELFEKYAQPNLIQPTFITMFPADITPLAKRSEKDERFAERFEGYIGGLEVCNGYSELNNPIEQYKRFKEEEELRKAVKKEELEFMPMDKDFVRALEYGMPPTGGIGIGIARLASIFTDKLSIKEVLLFPAVSSREEIVNLPDFIPESLKEFDC